MTIKSNNYFHENLLRVASEDESLAQKLRLSYRQDYPEIRLSKDKSPIPIIARKSLHSTYNPVAEAQKWVDSLNLEYNPNTLYVVGGLGFAYHIASLNKIIPPEQLVVVEKDPALAAAALANMPPDTFPHGLRFIVDRSVVQVYKLIQELKEKDQRDVRFLVHPASGNAYPDYYSTIRGVIQVQDTVNFGGYKILLVSPMYGGSLPVTEYVHRALLSLGHRCELLDNTCFYPGLEHIHKLTSNKQHLNQLDAMMTTFLAETITARALEVNADLVLVMAQGPVTNEVLKELEKVDIRTAFWFVEDGSALQYWKAISPQFDGFFAIQKGDFWKQLKNVGCHNPYYLPMAADPSVHRPLDMIPEEIEEYGSDLSHVGAGYYNRREFFAGLLDLDFKLWGSDWEKAPHLNQVIQRDGERISTEDTVKIFNATKINLNLHSSTYHSGVNPFGDFLNPRTFEIAACGGFQLVDERSYLPENFEVGKEMICFTSLQEMRELAKEFLSKPDKRIEIASASRERVLAEHTYEHRMLELLGVMAGRFADWKPKGGGLPSAEEIIREAGPESELAEVMHSFAGQGPLTLEDVASEIEKREGKFTKTEAMILLLNEFRRWGLEKGVM